ncbi:hypothetical protein M1M07_23745 [Rhodococcus sp. HM1]|uniref:hypothetical protein n=1 Tax=Rhodococcus sp. HM1 TaxID=2937759 RepID=UPI00200B883D|nr:hypothetical protein [Rhodococcus sp. HM1]MCK8674111.1 hypothetical protein [Rhodococcus sp. HM1]
MNDPTTPEGRAELRERHVLATDHGKETLATRHLTHPTIYVDHSDGNEDGLVGALPIWGNRYAELIVAAVNALPALLDALDDAECEIERQRGDLVIERRRANAAEAALARVRKVADRYAAARPQWDRLPYISDDRAEGMNTAGEAILRALDGDQ